MLVQNIQYASNDRSYLAYKYTTLASGQRDLVVRTALTAAIVVPSTMFIVYDPPNSETRVLKLFPNFPVVNTTWEAVHVQFLIRKLVFTIIPIAREGSIRVMKCIPFFSSVKGHDVPRFRCAWNHRSSAAAAMEAGSGMVRAGSPTETRAQSRSHQGADGRFRRRKRRDRWRVARL